MIKNENRVTSLPDWVVDEMVSYLYVNGMIIKNKDSTGVAHVPVTVFPSNILRSLFEKIEFYQIAFNKMVDRMSRDNEFLHSTLKEISVGDDFVKNYLEISTKANQFPKKQNIQLGIFRNDFMIDKVKKFIYQIEINTIAASMGTFSDGMKKFFSYFSKKYPEYYEKYFNVGTSYSNNIPLHKEDVIDSIAESMYSAVKLFSPENYQSTLIVFIVQDTEKNVFDQRSVESALWEKYNLHSRRLSLKELLSMASYDSNQNLIIDSKIVSLVYFRAAYTDKDFPDEDSWKAREMIELSTAIKCPNVDTFLCTFKVFQYYLQKPEVLKKFLPDELIANDIVRFFAKIYYVPLMTEEEKKTVFKEIRENIGKYIVKPQKEGGGNNYYNEDILDILPPEDDVSDVGPVLKHAMIMERINPPEQQTLIIADNKLKTQNCISEISVYGIILSDEKTIHFNKSVGFLIRTKDVATQEGGVVVGASAVDLPYLVDKLDD